MEEVKGTTVIWKGLLFDGKDFSSLFKICNDGRIMNKKTKHYPKQKWEGNILYSTVYFNNRAYRIKIGQAQVDSGLDRFIFDKNPIITEKAVYEDGKKSEFTQKQLVELEEIIRRVLTEMIHDEQKKIRMDTIDNIMNGIGATRTYTNHNEY